MTAFDGGGTGGAWESQTPARSFATPRYAAPKSGRVLVVDDDELTRHLLARVLAEAGNTCQVAADAEEARAALIGEHFDVVLTDMNMPGASGVELISHIGDRHRTTAVILITGMDDPKLADLALRLGAYGYMIKPFKPTEVVVAVSNALRRRSLELAMRRQTSTLERVVEERTKELRDALERLELANGEVRASREQTIHRLALAAEYRDGPTARHVERMSLYCALLAADLGADPARCEEIRLASLMHDVGKIGVPDQILLKPGALDPEEWEIMRSHAELGYRILCDSGSELLDTAATIALTHHERMDGTGYPQGLHGDEIPIEGRIAAVADVFDAVTSDRVYRNAFSLTEARAYLEREKGTQFDPVVLDAFMDSWDQVQRIKTGVSQPSS